MNSSNNPLVKFFGVVARGQTYLNLLYLLLAFPLGIFYFVFLVTGLALGIPLVIIWVGLLILLAVFAAWYGMAAFERQLAIWLLREDIPPMTRENLSGKGLWQSFKSAAVNPVTWKGLVYLFAKFPLGILSFVVVTVMLSIALALVAAPFYYPYADPGIYFWDLRGWDPWIIDTLEEALILSVIGILFTPVALHVTNGLAYVSGKFARVMLGTYASTPVQGPPSVSMPVMDSVEPSGSIPPEADSTAAQSNLAPQGR